MSKTILKICHNTLTLETSFFELHCDDLHILMDGQHLYFHSEPDSLNYFIVDESSMSNKDKEAIDILLEDTGLYHSHLLSQLPHAKMKALIPDIEGILWNLAKYEEYWECDVEYIKYDATSPWVTVVVREAA